VKRILLAVLFVILCASGAFAVPVANITSFDVAMRANESAIELQADIKLEALSSDYTVGGNLTINGGGYKIDCNGFRLLSSSGTLKIDNTMIQNAGTTQEAVMVTAGAATFSGGTIFSGNKATAVNVQGSSVLFDGVTFSDNGDTSIPNLNGGAVRIGTGANASFSGTVLFENNKASENGGAIYSENASATLVIPTNVTFKNNSASKGGAIYSKGSVDASHGTFTGNSATTHGGAIYAEDKLTVAPTSGTASFTGHTAGDRGGALASDKGMELKNASFSGNTAKAGGAVWSGGMLDAEEVVFTGNTASESGGAVFAEQLTFKAVTLRENKATGQYGGALFLNGNAGGSRIENTLFAKNQANFYGGAIYLTGSGHSVTVTQSVFEENYAAANGGAGTSEGGGALSLAGDNVVLSQCTFSDNYIQSGTNAFGGAVSLSSKRFGIVNTTFHGNKAEGGNGGALYLSAGAATTGQSAIFYCTFTNNTAGGGDGGAMYTATPSFSLGTSVFVDNVGTNGKDVFRAGGTISTLGYNIVGNYGVTGSSGTPNPDYNWRADTEISGPKDLDANGPTYTKTLIFGSNGLAANETKISAGSAQGNLRTVDTVRLADSSSAAINPALDRLTESDARNLFNTYFASFSHTDARGVSRPVPAGGKCDIGAYESSDQGGGPGPGPSQGVISHVRLSGIPNNMTSVGQTCSLTALVTYQNGETATDEALEWSSSNTGVAQIDAYGNMVSLRQGVTTITVTTLRTGVGGERKSDSAELKVERSGSYTNIHPDLWNRLARFNAGVTGAQIYFGDSNPADLTSASFAGAFRSLYGVDATQVTELGDANDVNFRTSASASGFTSLNPSAGISLYTKASEGAVLPLRFAFSIEWDTVRAILGRETRTVSDTDVRELFETLRFVFVDEKGNAADVVGGDGVSATSALSSHALTHTSGNALVLTLDLFVADAQRLGAPKPSLMGSKLVVADNSVNDKISGELWLARGSGGGTGGGEGGGGGGCDTGFGALAALAGWALLHRKRR
jgi:Chlamydia polymorphic membrane protein (Chlamydia_PMP)./Bacterial Ig-like domain (group 2).